MIIFGTRGVNSTIKSGDFHCPQCNRSEAYRHIKVTNFFTLYFIPLIPLGNAGEYVECSICKGTFVTRVLEETSSNKEEFMAIYEKAIRHSMVKIMLADGIIDENEKNQVISIINKFSNNDISESQLEEYIKRVKNEDQDVTTYLKMICPSLNEHGKETIIKCAIHISLADGNFDDSEKEMILKMAESLEMAPSHVKGIFAEMFETIEE
jgi:uncharacterized tellurite resistance protein B-like protein